MKFSLFSILSALVLFAIPCSAAGEEPVAVSAKAVHINWYEIPPDIRRYLILMTAVSMELNAELPDGGINPAPQQQFDMMQKIVERTPVDFLTGEARAYITEANRLNLTIVDTLRREAPEDRASILAVRERFAPQIDELAARYPTVSRYFTPEAQVFISMMIIRETDLQRVMMQASMAGKSRQEAMRTAVEHLRYEAEQQF